MGRENSVSRVVVNNAVNRGNDNSDDSDESPNSPVGSLKGHSVKATPGKPYASSADDKKAEPRRDSFKSDSGSKISDVTSIISTDDSRSYTERDNYQPQKTPSVASSSESIINDASLDAIDLGIKKKSIFSEIRDLFSKRVTFKKLMFVYFPIAVALILSIALGTGYPLAMGVGLAIIYFTGGMIIQHMVQSKADDDSSVIRESKDKFREIIEKLKASEQKLVDAGIKKEAHPFDITIEDEGEVDKDKKEIKDPSTLSTWQKVKKKLKIAGYFILGATIVALGIALFVGTTIGTGGAFGAIGLAIASVLGVLCFGKGVTMVLDDIDEKQAFLDSQKNSTTNTNTSDDNDNKDELSDKSGATDNKKAYTGDEVQDTLNYIDDTSVADNPAIIGDPREFPPRPQPLDPSQLPDDHLPSIQELKKKRKLEKSIDQKRIRALENSIDQENSRDRERIRALENSIDRENSRDRERIRDLENSIDQEKKKDLGESLPYDMFNNPPPPFNLGGPSSLNPAASPHGEDWKHTSDSTSDTINKTNKSKKSKKTTATTATNAENDTYNLTRFKDAHDGKSNNVSFRKATTELQQGQKKTHWMWYVFPQSAEFSKSERGKFYGIKSQEEALAYMNDPILGTRLVNCTKYVLTHKDKSLESIFNSRGDAKKFHSCMQLFNDTLHDYIKKGKQLPRWLKDEKDIFFKGLRKK